MENEINLDGEMDHIPNTLFNKFTCTATERAFLDEIKEKGNWLTSRGDNGIQIGEDSLFWQEDFTANLKELIKEPTKKQICPLCNEPYDSIEHGTSCQLFGG